jgi:MFS family permease
MASTLQTTKLQKNSILAGVAEGFHYIRTSPVIMAILVCFALTNFGMAPLFVLLPTLIKALESGPSGMALLTTCLAVGGLVGSMISAAMPNVKRKGVLVTGGMATASAFTIALALAPTMFWATILAACVGVSFPLVQVNVNVIYQKLVPTEMQGRVFAVRFFVARCLTPLGVGAAGLLATHLGVRSVLATCAAIGCIASICVLLSRPIRSLEV